MSQKNLIGVEREDLRLGEAPLDLDREHRLLHLAMKRAVGRKKQIARQLHGQGRCALHLPAGLNVAVRRADDAPEIDSGMPVEVFVFNGNQRIPQDRSEIIVARDYSSLQGERSNHAPVIVIQLSDRTGTVRFQCLDLRQICGVDQQKPGGRSHQCRNQHQQAEQHRPTNLRPAISTGGRSS